MVDLNELIEQLRSNARPCDILEAADTIEALRTALSKAEARIVELSGMLGGTTIRHVLNDRKALESSLAEAKRLLEWQPMESAPRDGTIVNVLGRYVGASAGFPRYAGFDAELGRWMEYTRHQPEPLTVWAWRPRPDWPDEGRPLPLTGAEPMSADTEKLIAELRRIAKVGFGYDITKADRIALTSAADRIASLENDIRIGCANIDREIARADAAEKALAEAREALEPFGEVQGHFDGHVRDDDPVPLALSNIRARHIRRAAALSNGGRG